MKPYYEQDGITIFNTDTARFTSLAEAFPDAVVMVTDPPYGIAYKSGHAGTLARSIAGDLDTTLRDGALQRWDRPALVFGSWKVQRPTQTRQVLIWDTLGALGMGDLALPWKPAHQEIYVLGSGFSGHRGTDVLSYPPVQASAWRGRIHPNEKPVPLMRALIAKCPPGTILDPFMGSGATLRAAKDCGRAAIGIEIDRDYCALAVERLRQAVLL